MSIEEFRQGIEQIRLDGERQKSDLIAKYCEANARFKPGEIVEDHIGKVLVERLLYSYHFSVPVPVYRGKVLRKDGQLSKRGETRDVYQSNIKP